MKTKIPPPIVAVFFALFMWELDRLVPMTKLALPWAGVIALTLILLGLAIMGSALGRFRKAGTTVNPLDPTQASSLVSSGMFRRSRNPMYLGMLVILTGWAIWLGNLVNIAALYLFFSFMTRFQIKPEEQALIKLFGQEYEDYCNRVSRWI